MGNLWMYPPQDDLQKFFTRKDVLRSQAEFQPIFANALGEGTEIDTMNAISVLSHFVNHVLYVESSANVWSGQNDRLTRMIAFARHERGLVLPGTMLDGRDFHWDYEKGKLSGWLDHMGLTVDSCPDGHHLWDSQTRSLLGNRRQFATDAFYGVYQQKLIDYPRLAFIADYLSMQLVQLAARVKTEYDRKIMLFLSAVCRLGSADMEFIMENRRFLDRESAKLIIEGPARDIGIALRDSEPYPFTW